MIGEYPCCPHFEFPDEIVHNYPCPLCQWRTPKTEDEREGCPVKATEKKRDDDIDLAVRVGDEWVPVSATPTSFDWADADNAEPEAEEWSLGEQSWSMTVELAESEPAISMIRRLGREERQRRMLARWWLRFPYPVRARCSRGWLV